MIQMAGVSLKGWVLAVGTPIVAFLAASILGAILGLLLVCYCASCRRRWVHGARGRDLIALHMFGGHDERS